MVRDAGNALRITEFLRATPIRQLLRLKPMKTVTDLANVTDLLWHMEISYKVFKIITEIVSLLGGF